MQRSLTMMLALAFATSFAMAQEVKRVPKEILDQITDPEPNPLPRHMTEEEKLMPLPQVSPEEYATRTPPAGSVRCPAEYELNEGVLFAWESYTSLLTEMTVAITTGDPDATVFMVVDTTSEQNSVYNTLNSAGADMSQVEFVVRTTDSVWIRDYGPRYIMEDNVQAIIDHTYNRPSRPNDNALNDYLAVLWDEAEYDIPLTHGGGNFHLFSNGDAFMTDLILDENPGLSEQDVIDLYAEYQGVNLTIYGSFPFSFDGTKHIDMWMLPVGDDKVIIGEYSPSTGVPYEVTEAAVADLEARGYTVYRTPGWNSGGAHYTYTNALIMNDIVFISSFNHANDAVALAVFEEAMPDHTIIQLDCSSIIYAAGALHCIAMHKPAEPVIALTITLPDGAPSIVEPGVATPITVSIEDGSESYVPGSGMIHYRFDGGTYLSDPLTPLGGVLYEATLPAAACDDTPEFYFSAAGDGGTTVYNPDDAPASVYSAMVGTMTVVLQDDFETDQGWTVENDPGLYDGGWERADPRGDCNRGDPPSDFDGSGYCYVTDNDLENCNSDVDGGPTHLISPTMDLTGLVDPILSYAYWWSNDDQDGDPFTVAISNDDGGSWIELTTYTNIPEGWYEDEFHVNAYIEPTSTMKIRFSAHDIGGASIDEGGVDAVQVYEFSCGPEASSDFDYDGDVDFFDFTMLQDCFGSSPIPGPCQPCDMDDDEAIDLSDFELFIADLEGPQ
jgi:agmatine deiminase